MEHVIYADLRCFQDSDNQDPRIANHAAALLRARKLSALSDSRAIGLIDSRLPKPAADVSSIVDEINCSVNPCLNSAGALFLDGSPMSHDLRFSLRFQNHPGVLRAAVLYDLIAPDSPEVGPSVASRMKYLAHLGRLRNFDLFFPVSQDTASRLSELLGIAPGKIHVTGESVSASFWTTIEAAFESRHFGTVIAKRQKPRLAFLSPYPPDDSAAAQYTVMTMRAGEQLFRSDIYTDAPRPLPLEGASRDAGRISVAPIAGKYDGVVSVLGHSSFDARILQVFEQYGGPCILHDPGSLPAPVMEQVIERASPLIVHTARQEAEIKERYGADAHVTTCCPTVFFMDQDLTSFAKQAARERLGIARTDFVVSSFGHADRANGMRACLFAIELLRSWKVPAELFFVGSVSEKDEIHRISTLYGIEGHVHTVASSEDDKICRDFMIASDAAVQLQAYRFGMLPTALMNCISAALPCVTTNDLATACDGSAYAATIPNRFSPLQVAEQLAAIWEAQSPRADRADARAAYLASHNFKQYAKRLIEILGIAS